MLWGISLYHFKYSTVAEMAIVITLKRVKFQLSASRSSFLCLSRSNFNEAKFQRNSNAPSFVSSIATDDLSDTFTDSFTGTIIL